MAAGIQCESPSQGSGRKVESYLSSRYCQFKSFTLCYAPRNKPSLAPLSLAIEAALMQS